MYTYFVRAVEIQIEGSHSLVVARIFGINAQGAFGATWLCEKQIRSTGDSAFSFVLVLHVSGQPPFRQLDEGGVTGSMVYPIGTDSSRGGQIACTRLLASLMQNVRFIQFAQE